MKRFKFLALMLVFALCISSMGTTYVSATVIDINEEPDSFSLKISPNSSKISRNDYYPYGSRNDASLIVRMYTDNSQTIAVRLFDDTTGSFIMQQTAEAYRSTLYFNDLNINHIYYFEFYNHDSQIAYLDVEIL